MVKKRVVGKGRTINATVVNAMQALEQDPGVERRLSMIQMLIPLGLKAVEAELRAEVEKLAGRRHSRGRKISR